MTILEDHAWPHGLLDIFDHAQTRRTIFEDRYSGPYNSLLNYCFMDSKSSFSYYVAPQFRPHDDKWEGSPDVVAFEVFDAKRRPVLLVGLGAEDWAEYPEFRYAADSQLRDRYSLMLEERPTTHLWGLSLLGTTFNHSLVNCNGQKVYRVNFRTEPLGVV